MIPKCKNWRALVNSIPGRSAEVTVSGDVQVGNPGVGARLTQRVLDPARQNLWVLDLHLFQQPGMWPQILTYTQVKWARMMEVDESLVSSIEIVHQGELVVLIDQIDKVQ